MCETNENGNKMYQNLWDVAKADTPEVLSNKSLPQKTKNFQTTWLFV